MNFLRVATTLFILTLTITVMGHQKSTKAEIYQVLSNIFLLGEIYNTTGPLSSSCYRNAETITPLIPFLAPSAKRVEGIVERCYSH